MNVVVFGKVFDNTFVGEKSCLFKAIHSIIDLEANHIFGDVLVEVKLEYSLVRNLFTFEHSLFRNIWDGA